MSHPLAPHLPPASLSAVVELLEKYPIRFVITKGRQTKLGDYKSPATDRERHRISVNGTLNQYAFLITTLHEFAHLLVKVRHPKNRFSPHGLEWKITFQEVMAPFLTESIFPIEILRVLIKHMHNPTASSTADHELMAAIQKYDLVADNLLIVDELEANDIFILPNGWLMKVLRKDRKRWLCERLSDGRMYKVHPLTKVQKK